MNSRVSTWNELQDDGTDDLPPEEREARLFALSPDDISGVALPPELANELSPARQLHTEETVKDLFSHRRTAAERAPYNRVRQGYVFPESGSTPAQRELQPPAARMRAWFRERFPVLVWLPAYSKALLRADLSAGLTVGVVLIPQGVAYAMLAELPPSYGLYAALAPLPMYAICATSRHMAIGPFALVSLLVADSVSEVVDPENEERYVQAVTLLSLLVGLLHLGMAALRLGAMANLLSDSVLSGFTAASALLISASQLKHLLGLPIPRGTLLQTVFYAITHAADANVGAVAFGLGGIACLVLVKRLNKRCCPKIQMPEQLLLLILATAVSALTSSDLPPVSLPVVGYVPSGLPTPRLPPLIEGHPWTFDDDELLPKMVKPALVVGVFSFILSISIVRTFAIKYEYQVRNDQELVALGLANLAGSLLLSYPTSGSLSRSALVSASCGAECTPMHGVFTALLVLLVLLFLTPAFRPMPRAVLASIVFMAVRSLLDFRKPRFLWRVKKVDFGLWLVAFGGTILFGVQLGILIAVVASLGAIVVRSSRPHHATLGRLPGSRIYRDLRRYPGSATVPGVAIFRFDAELHFANKDYFYAAALAAVEVSRAAAKRGLEPSSLGATLATQSASDPASPTPASPVPRPTAAVTVEAPTAEIPAPAAGSSPIRACASDPCLRSNAPAPADATGGSSGGGARPSELPAFHGEVSALVIVGESINDIDASALRMLQARPFSAPPYSNRTQLPCAAPLHDRPPPACNPQDLQKELKKQRLLMLFSGCKGPVRDVMQRADFFAECGRQRFFPHLDDAINYGARLHLLRASGWRPGIERPGSGRGGEEAAASGMEGSVELGALAADAEELGLAPATREHARLVGRPGRFESLSLGSSRPRDECADEAAALTAPSTPPVAGRRAEGKRALPNSQRGAGLPQEMHPADEAL